jgi:membrane-associated phospholipid phosphatase
VDKRWVGVAAGLAVAAAVLAIYIAAHPYIPADATFERDVQATNWGPLALTFPIFSFIGDAKGAILEAIILVLVLVFNRRAWIIAAAAALSGVWYLVLSHVIIRPRPTTAQVLQVTEHPGASSFPSGHTIFVFTVATVLMLCFGRRFLPRWAQPIGWAVVALIVAANAIGRIYTGAHWPTDVLEGLLIAGGWLTFIMSIRWISDRVSAKEETASSREASLAPDAGHRLPT